MNEDDPLAVGWDECPYHIHHRSADPTGAELWSRKHDHLRFTLCDRVGNTGLMQPGIRRFTRINLAQVADIAGDEITAARCWCTQPRCVRETSRTLTRNRAVSTGPSPCGASISRPQEPGNTKVTCVT